LGRTPLHICVENQRLLLVKLLLAFKANPNIRDEKGLTALDIAIQKGDQKIINYLTDYEKV
jgi:ankyrin repeat protein